MLRDEIIIGRDLTPADRQRLSRAAKAGRIRRLAHGYYTGNLKLPPEEVVLCNALHLAAAVQPGGVLTARSGFELPHYGKVKMLPPGPGILQEWCLTFPSWETSPCLPPEQRGPAPTRPEPGRQA